MGKRKSSEKTLRERAEEALRDKDMLKLGRLSEADTLKLIHELQVHQVELELQNEELTQAHFIAQQSAERYTELYDFSPTGYFTISQEGLILELNISGANLFGEVRSLVQGNRFEIFLAAQSKEIFKSFIENILRTKLKQTCEVNVSYRKNSKTIYLVGVLDESNEKYFISAADISELKTIQEKLVLALEKAEESEKLKTSFLQNLRHEIRTPMNAIIGFSNQLKEPELSASNRKEFASLVVSSANQLLAIINDIISVSLLETKQDKVNESNFSLNELLQELQAIFKPQAQSKNLQLDLTLSGPDGNDYVATDKAKLSQVITNLLINALKFTSTGKIEFGYTITESGLLFFVKDSGIGIEPSMHDKIFERFRQANNDIERKYGGTGLGLSISKGFVELLGGRIWVESTQGKGTSFYFTLPVLLGEGAAAQQRQLLGSPVILIAEDDEISFQFLSMAIQQGLVCEIHQARNGQEAIEMVNAKPEINFILMDVNMPVMSGIEAATKIKQLQPELFIMAQTGYDLLVEKEKNVLKLFDDFISKPIDEVLLISRIKKIFGQ